MNHRPIRRGGWGLRLAWAALAAALLVYGYGVSSSPLLDPDAEAARAVLRHAATGSTLDRSEEARLAEAYWVRYPDVAADRFFGRGGSMGIMGAREHYQRHGRREGRLWGP